MKTDLNCTRHLKVKSAVCLLAVGDEPLSDGFVVVTQSLAGNEQEVKLMCFSYCMFAALKTNCYLGFQFDSSKVR